MAEIKHTLPKWILIVSGFFAFIEIMVSFQLVFAPETVAENVDLGARGVLYIIYMWAARQFALGFITAFSIYKKSSSMLTLSFIFFLVMFLGDLIIGIAQKENPMIYLSLVMCLITSLMLFAINKNTSSVAV